MERARLMLCAMPVALFLVRPASQGEGNPQFSSLPPHSANLPMDQGGQCGYTYVEEAEGRIVGGREAEPHAYPWMVFLMFRYSDSSLNVSRHRCGGSLVSDSWVITAAHCSKEVKQVRGDSYYLVGVLVKLGFHDVKIPQDHGRTFFVSRDGIASHPGYNGVSHDNDISLIRLPLPIRFNHAIAPVCLPNPYGRFPEIVPVEGVILSGWGRIESNRATNALYVTSAEMIDRRLCQRFYKERITSSMMCTSAFDGRQCKGDSGGPVVMRDLLTNRYYQIGVVSFSLKVGGECPLGFPSVQSYVPAYIKWIQKVTGRVL